MAPDETLHDVWSDLGRSGPDRAPIAWQEIDAYLRLTGDGIGPEEARIVREMSEVYCGELSNLSPFAKAPIDKVDVHV